MIATSTLLWVGLGVGVAGTIAGAVTSGVQGAEQASMSNYNAELAAQQAEIQEENARRALVQAENEAIAKENDTARAAELEREKMERVKALNRAREGASGLTMEGTPLMLQIEAAENIEMNHLEMLRQGNDEAAAIRYRGQLAAYGHEVGAINSSAQKSSFTNMASNALVGGGMQAGTTLISGAGNAVMGYANMKYLTSKTSPAKTSFKKT